MDVYEELWSVVTQVQTGLVSAVAFSGMGRAMNAQSILTECKTGAWLVPDDRLAELTRRARDDLVRIAHPDMS
jgi:hypothetical protein